MADVGCLFGLFLRWAGLGASALGQHGLGKDIHLVPEFDQLFKGDAMGRVGIDPLFEAGQVALAGLFGIQFGEPFAGLGVDAFVVRKFQYCAVGWVEYRCDYSWVCPRACVWGRASLSLCCPLVC